MQRSIKPVLQMLLLGTLDKNSPLFYLRRHRSILERIWRTLMQKYVVTNKYSLSYRCSIDAHDMCRDDGVALGSVIDGEALAAGEGDWIHVDQYFLPIRLGGLTMLSKLRDGKVDVGAAQRGGGWVLPEDWEVFWSEQWNCPCFCDEWGGRVWTLPMTSTPADDGSGERFTAVSQAIKELEALSPTYSGVVDRMLAPEPHKPPEEVDESQLYVLLADQVPVRSEPTLESPVRDHLRRGTIVELSDWDPTWRWRKCSTQSSGSGLWMSTATVLLMHPKNRPNDKLHLEPICMAVSEDNLDDLRVFLLEGLNLHVVDGIGRTPLGLAAVLGRLDCCVYLINANADASQVTFGGPKSGLSTALVMALRGQAYKEEAFNRAFDELRPETQEVVEERMAIIAVEKQAEQLRKESDWANSVEKRLQEEKRVFGVVAENKLRELQDLISSGINLDQRDFNGLTPLMTAVQKGYIDAAVLLLQGGADPSMKFPNDVLGSRAVEMATSKAHLALFKALAGDQDFDVPNLDQAITQLHPDNQEIAERMIDSIAEEQASKRETEIEKKREEEEEERRLMLRHQQKLREENKTRYEQSAADSARLWDDWMSHLHTQNEKEKMQKDVLGEKVERMKALREAAMRDVFHSTTVGGTFPSISAKPGDSGRKMSPPEIGACYVVVADRVVIRTSPSPDAHLWGHIKKGAIVELFSWDSTRRWRRCFPKLMENGLWMDAHGGPLVRPRSRPSDEIPLSPIWTAVAENNLNQLRSFVMEGLDLNVPDPNGRTPLTLAAQMGRLQCCSLLHRGVRCSGDKTALIDALEASGVDVERLRAGADTKEDENAEDYDNFEWVVDDSKNNTASFLTGKEGYWTCTECGADATVEQQVCEFCGTQRGSGYVALVDLFDIHAG